MEGNIFAPVVPRGSTVPTLKKRYVLSCLFCVWPLFSGLSPLPLLQVSAPHIRQHGHHMIVWFIGLKSIVLPGFVFRVAPFHNSSYILSCLWVPPCPKKGFPARPFATPNSPFCPIIPRFLGSLIFSHFFHQYMFPCTYIY
jgi:hypothetical protein